MNWVTSKMSSVESASSRVIKQSVVLGFAVLASSEAAAIVR